MDECVCVCLFEMLDRFVLLYCFQSNGEKLMKIIHSLDGNLTYHSR